MRKGIEFLKDTFFKGLAALVPISAIGYALWALLQRIEEAAEEVERRFAELLSQTPQLPGETVEITGNSTGDWILVILISAFLFALLCLLVGLAGRTRLGDAVSRVGDRVVDRYLPALGAARRMTEKLSEGKLGEPKMVQVDLYGSGAEVYGWKLDDLPEDRVWVYIPSLASGLGQLYVLPRSRVKELEDSIKDSLSEILGPLADLGLTGKGSVVDSNKR
jgi:uncharacterized membrane protein